MAKRMTKAEQKALGGLLLIGIVVGTPIYIVGKLAETLGWQALIASVAVGLVAYLLLKWCRVAAREANRKAANEARRTQLLNKYGDEDIVGKIMAREIWQTQTAEQLRDSLGVPVDTDVKVMKAKRREVWKYHQTGVNRFGLRVTLEDGVVVGWDEKL